MRPLALVTLFFAAPVLAQCRPEVPCMERLSTGGYVLTEPGYQKLAAELRRLDGAVAQLTAENTSLRTSLETLPRTPRLTWPVAVVLLAAGALAGGALVVVLHH